MVTVEAIHKLLKQFDPYDKTCKTAMLVETLDGVDYTLHVDMNPDNKDYGHLWEWWLESSTDGFVAGGFEPANDDGQLMNLAAIIHGALKKTCG